MLPENVRHPLKVSTARVKIVFPLAIHLGGYIRYGVKVNISKCVPSISFVGGVPVWPPGEKLDKIFQLDPNGCVAHFWTVLDVSTRKIGNLKKVVVPPRTPPKTLPLIIWGGNSAFNSFPSHFDNFFKIIFFVAQKAWARIYLCHLPDSKLSPLAVTMGTHHTACLKSHLLWNLWFPPLLSYWIYPFRWIARGKTVLTLVDDT